MLLRMKKAKPIGMPNIPHSSSLAIEPSSHSVRIPLGRYSASPE